MKIASTLPFLCCLLLSATAAAGVSTVRRYALVVGANDGGSGRVALKYAVSDAESFARVMETLGGVTPSDSMLLNQPTLLELEDALEELRHRIAAKDSPRTGERGDRTEVVVYVSGHANETGLLLGKETFSYRSLRNWMDLVEADVRIAVLDACASGTITRLKGTRRRSPFLVDSSSDMRGHAFLTSSSADEVAQESDSIGRSFFTHYLVSGLRGAADSSGDGRVTLNEAYQFAFYETLGRTTETQHGTQHPSYDINLSGTGDVVITDVRVTSAALVLGEALSGRFFIRDSDQRLEVELFKPSGRRIELGLEPGTYTVLCRSDSGSSISEATLIEDGQVVLTSQEFTPSKQERAAIRSGEGIGPRLGGLKGRFRVGALLGFWNSGGLGSSDSDFNFAGNNTAAGATVSYWISEKWSVDFSAWTTMSLVQGEQLSPDDAYISAFLFGGRRYFPNIGGLRPSIRPFVAGAVGPYFRNASSREGDAVRGVAVGGSVGGGFDIQLARWCMLGTKAGYNFTADFTKDFSGTFGEKTSYSGFELGLNFSVLLGTPNTY